MWVKSAQSRKASAWSGERGLTRTSSSPSVGLPVSTPWPGRGQRRKCHPKASVGGVKPSPTSAIPRNRNSSTLRGYSVRSGHTFSNHIKPEMPEDLSKIGFSAAKSGRTTSERNLGEVLVGWSHKPASTRSSIALDHTALPVGCQFVGREADLAPYLFVVGPQLRRAGRDRRRGAVEAGKRWLLLQATGDG